MKNGTVLDGHVRAESFARFDIGGPWVDVDPYRRELGIDGATLNVPISLTATVEASRRLRSVKASGPSGSYQRLEPDFTVEIEAKETGARAEIEAKELEQAELDTSLRLAQAAVVRLGIKGVSIRTSSSAPAGSGVGSSSAMVVSIIKALNMLSGSQMSLEEVIRMARDIETVNLGIAGGWQDYYPAAYGRGVHFMIWEGGENGGNLHEQVVVPDGFIHRLNRTAVFVYSGKSRLSGGIHEHVYGALRTGGKGVRNAFDALAAQAYDARDAFRAGDFEEICSLVNDSWECQKLLHESVTNPDIEALFACAFKNGAIAGKAGGAGGGGCLLFLADDPSNRERIVAGINRHISESGLKDARVLDCQIVA